MVGVKLWWLSVFSSLILAQTFPQTSADQNLPSSFAARARSLDSPLHRLSRREGPLAEDFDPSDAESTKSDGEIDDEFILEQPRPVKNIDESLSEFEAREEISQDIFENAAEAQTARDLRRAEARQAVDPNEWTYYYEGNNNNIDEGYYVRDPMNDGMIEDLDMLGLDTRLEEMHDSSVIEQNSADARQALIDANSGFRGLARFFRTQWRRLASKLSEWTRRFRTVDAAASFSERAMLNLSPETSLVVIESATKMTARKGMASATKVTIALACITLFILVAYVAYESKPTSRITTEAELQRMRISPTTIRRDDCQRIAALASRSEGIAHEKISLARWSETLTLFAPVYYEAYTFATSSMIQNISSTLVTNWGAPALLPALPDYDSDIFNTTEIQTEYKKALAMWKWNEDLRQQLLQHELNEEHRRSIHVHANRLMRERPNLPYPATSHLFMIGLTGFIFRMEIPFYCLRNHVKEDPVTKARFKQPRQEQLERQTSLQLVASKYFAARSSMEPTPPIAAVRSS